MKFARIGAAADADRTETSHTASPPLAKHVEKAAKPTAEPFQLSVRCACAAVAK